MVRTTRNPDPVADFVLRIRKSSIYDWTSRHAACSLESESAPDPELVTIRKASIVARSALASCLSPFRVIYFQTARGASEAC